MLSDIHWYTIWYYLIPYSSQLTSCLTNSAPPPAAPRRLILARGDQRGLTRYRAFSPRPLGDRSWNWGSAEWKFPQWIDEGKSRGNYGTMTIKLKMGFPVLSFPSNSMIYRFSECYIWLHRIVPVLWWHNGMNGAFHGLIWWHPPAIKRDWTWRYDRWIVSLA